MPEWDAVLRIFWALWAVNGMRLVRQPGLTARDGRMDFGRFSWLGVWPGGWRIVLADVPFSVSPAGVSNRPAGVVGRPADPPRVALAFLWEEVRKVGLARGWVYINDRRFCPDSGHLPAPEFLALAALPPADRERRLRDLLRDWLRPAHVRRRALVLRARTATVVMLNALLLVLLAALTAQLAAGGTAAAAPGWSPAVADRLPLLLGCLALLHAGACAAAGIALRRLKIVSGKDQRRAALLGAFFFPPQALRLRAMLGEGFFPVQHPFAIALALVPPGPARDRWLFQGIADLHWPIDDRDDPALAR